METNIAILMADLSGYTAMTEIHGAMSAADIIERYLAIVKRSLVGDSQLHERVGDQVVIVSSHAENLAYTASFLYENVHNEDYFLALHAGLHYGPVVKKNNAYFGSTINAAARIMSAADKGKIVCSDTFLNQLPGNHSFAVNPKGAHTFKNLRQSFELFEINCCIRHLSKTYEIDPVCHMLIKSPDKALHISHPDRSYYFCSQSCMEMFNTLHPEVN